MAKGKADVHRDIINKMSGYVPKFEDVFDEETFYIFFFVLAIVVIVIAIIASRFIEVKDAGHVD